MAISEASCSDNFHPVRLGSSERTSKLGPSSLSPTVQSRSASARFQNFQRRTVLPVWIERGDAFRKDFLLRDGVEQRHARPEFHVVWRAEDIGYCLFACRQNEARTFEQARPEHIVLEVSDGLGARGDCEALRHRAEAETGDLRKDEPHPMCPFS